MIELWKLLDRYPTFELNSFGLKNLFLVALEQLGDSIEEIRGYASSGNMLWGNGPAYGFKSIHSTNKYLNINLIDLPSNWSQRNSRKSNPLLSPPSICSLLLLSKETFLARSKTKKWVIYQPSILLMARSNLLVPTERKKNFNYFLSERED